MATAREKLFASALCKLLKDLSLDQSEEWIDTLQELEDGNAIHTQASNMYRCRKLIAIKRPRTWGIAVLRHHCTVKQC